MERNVWFYAFTFRYSHIAFIDRTETKWNCWISELKCHCSGKLQVLGTYQVLIMLDSNSYNWDKCRCVLKYIWLYLEQVLCSVPWMNLSRTHVMSWMLSLVQLFCLPIKYSSSLLLKLLFHSHASQTFKDTVLTGRMMF